MSYTLDTIRTSVKVLAERGGITPARAFASWYAVNFFELDEDEAIELAEADGGNDQGIDMVFFDRINEEIIVLQSFYPDNLQKITPKKKWDAVIASLPYIKDPNQLIPLGRRDLAETINTLKDEHPDCTITVGLITLSKHSTEIDNSLQAHRNDKSLSELQFFYLAQEDIIDKYQHLIDTENGIQEEEINFSGEHFIDTGDYGTAWIGSISASELKRLHAQYGDKLFAGNIRYFLGAREGGINAKMIETAQKTPGHFWALNNGITIVADTVEPTTPKSKSLLVKRFSIVNGCQTTTSLAKADSGNNNDAKVLLRIIAAKRNLKNEIVRFNNSQNSIKIWTVRAVDDIQEKLREEFKAIGVDYAPKQSGARRKRNENIIELDKVAQYLAASKNDFLIQAINNKGDLFDEPYKKIFSHDIKGSIVYLAWKIGELADHLRTEFSKNLGTDPNGILVGVVSRFWIVNITYKIIDKFIKNEINDFDLNKMNHPEFSNALKKYISTAIEIYFDAAIDTYDRNEFGSVTSALRSNKFLNRMNSKTNARIVKLTGKSIPNLKRTLQSIKLMN